MIRTKSYMPAGSSLYTQIHLLCLAQAPLTQKRGLKLFVLQGTEHNFSTV